MDPLSDALQAIELSGLIFLRGDFGGEYGVSMPPPTLSHPIVQPKSGDHRLVMFHIVQEGQGYVEVEGYEPQHLCEGDLIIVFDDLFHSLVDAPGRPTVQGASLPIVRSEAAVPLSVTLGEDEPTLRIVCGMLQFVAGNYNPVFDALPAFLHISKTAGPSSSWMQQNISHIVREAEQGRPGSGALLGRLTELLFVETLRCHLESLPDSESGWLAALNDPIVGKAIQQIHETPHADWTVAELAKRSGASRSSFAARFNGLLGIAPLAYVTRWRIRLAMNLLRDASLSLADVATEVGYESESSFSRAFKREAGAPPSTWRNRARTPEI
jgi:AraC-like DNA-binding protein